MFEVEDTAPEADEVVANQQLDRGDDAKSPLDTAGIDEPDADVSAEEGEETPEEAAEREKQEAEEAKRKNIRIPKARFDEVQQRARQREQALLGEIERLKGGQQVSDTQQAVAMARAQITELQDKYEDLIMDGRKDEARAVRRQVDALREELTDFQTSQKSEAARRAAIEDLSYSAQLASLESTYPALNPEHAAFDEAQTNEVAELLSAFVKSGMSRTAALTKAVRYVVGAPPAEQVSNAGKALAEERARKAREKAAAANAAQPTSSSKVGLNSDKAGGKGQTGVDVMRLSQEKFAKLDEDTKASLRGDEL